MLRCSTHEGRQRLLDVVVRHIHRVKPKQARVDVESRRRVHHTAIQQAAAIFSAHNLWFVA
jgi:hypothetical protein